MLRSIHGNTGVVRLSYADKVLTVSIADVTKYSAFENCFVLEVDLSEGGYIAVSA